MMRPGLNSQFENAIRSAVPLVYHPGLVAITEGKSKIRPSKSWNVLGSANIDADCCDTDPNGSRWDYVVGYSRDGKAIAFFVEVHSAGSHNVAEMEKKIDWLREFLKRPTSVALCRLPCEYHWVASGRFNIPKHLPQYRRLQTLKRKMNLEGPHKELTLR